MARDAVTITRADLDGAVTPAGTAISVANGASIDVGGDTSDFMVIVTNTATTPDHDVTIQSGANPPALRESLGDRVINAASAAGVCFTVDGSRHIQADGKVYLDFETGMTGFVKAFRLAEV